MPVISSGCADEQQERVFCEVTEDSEAIREKPAGTLVRLDDGCSPGERMLCLERDSSEAEEVARERCGLRP